ncbi:MAG: class I SAM-dependent methyltransferase [Chloroflexota bacterium]
MSDETFQRFVERYDSKELPWADELPPPEVIELAPKLMPGRALDLGCGYGRTAIYLAQRGWQVDGIDFVPAAIEEAKKRAAAAGVSNQAQFHVGSASQPSMISGQYDLAIDIGCMHSFSGEQLSDYYQSLRALLREGAVYLLYVHFKDEQDHGIVQGKVEQLFADGFMLDRVELGTSQVEDQPVYDSAWYWFRRTNHNKSEE